MPMPAESALLDANVLVPDLLRDTLLSCADLGLYVVRWSPTIINEMRRTLIARGMASTEAVERLIAQMERAFPYAVVTNYEPIKRTLTVNEGISMSWPPLLSADAHAL